MAATVNTVSNGSPYITIKLSDYTKEVKARMALNSYFTAPVEVEKSLLIEPWMVNPACFVGPGYKSYAERMEPEINIRALRAKIEALPLDDDPPLALEAWMSDPNHFPSKGTKNAENHFAENKSK